MLILIMKCSYYFQSNIFLYLYNIKIFIIGSFKIIKMGIITKHRRLLLSIFDQYAQKFENTCSMLYD